MFHFPISQQLHSEFIITLTDQNRNYMHQRPAPVMHQRVDHRTYGTDNKLYGEVLKMQTHPQSPKSL